MNVDAFDAIGDVITLQQVHKAFGSVVAVQTADLGIRKGEFFSLLGPSGCGKTTILRMIAGFEQPTSGRVLLDGKDVADTPPHKRNVNTVFQQYALFPHMSVFDNVAFGPRSRGGRDGSVRPKVMAMLDTVRLGDLATRRPAQLSGGQQQRVALARALVNLPSALLLDEPLAALDLKLRHAMQLELKRIQREVGITFVFVTHDQDEALTMSDRIAVMNHGRVEQVGTPVEVYNAPASLFVAGFIGTANLLPATVRGVTGGVVRAGLAGGVVLEADARGRSFPEGAAVTVMLRPEQLRLSRAQPADGPALPVVVEQLVFQGPTVRAALRTGDGVPLLAHVSPADAGTAIGAGEPAWVSWPATAPYVLPEAAASAGATGLDVDEVEASL